MDQYGQNGATAVSGKQNDVMTLGDWLITMLLTIIPIVGFILMIIWAVGGDNVPLSKRNYFRAALIMTAIGTVLYIFIIGIVGASLFSTMTEYGY